MIYAAPWRTLIYTTTYALHDTTCTRPLAFSLAHAAIYPTHPLIQTTTKATEYHGGTEFLFRIAFYIHIYTPTCPSDGHRHTSSLREQHLPSGLDLGHPHPRHSCTTNHTTPKPPPVSLLLSSTPDNPLLYIQTCSSFFPPHQHWHCTGGDPTGIWSKILYIFFLWCLFLFFLTFGVSGGVSGETVAWL